MSAPFDAAGVRLDARQKELVNEHRHVVERVRRRCARWLSPWLDRDDIEQNAQVGLIQAAHAFRSEEGVPFAGFSWKHCMGVVVRAARREDRQRRIASAVFEHLASSRRRGDVLTDTPESAATELREHATQAMMALALAATFDAGPNIEERVVALERRAEIRAAVAELGAELRPVIELHYFERHELRVVAERLGISYATVRRRHEAALSLLACRLRAPAEGR
jgi:RNA polymerase sigma factor (sigma-70 family)